MSNNTDQRDGAMTAVSSSTPVTVKSLPSLRSSDLFRHGNTVQIEHEDQCYLLRLTKGNKLILTK